MTLACSNIYCKQALHNAIIPKKCTSICTLSTRTNKSITKQIMTPNQPANAWDAVESVETSLVKFETVGKVVIGVLLSRKMTNTKFGESPFYKMLTNEGETGFFASGLLDDKLSGQIGQIVRVEFSSTTPSNKGNDAKIFDVKAMPDTPENRIKVGLGENW